MVIAKRLMDPCSQECLLAVVMIHKVSRVVSGWFGELVSGDSTKPGR